MEKANYFFKEASEHANGAYWLEEEDPYLLNLMKEAPFSKNAVDVVEPDGEIGVCYANGKGVRQDYLKAYKYFSKCLLLEPERGGLTYENMTIIYPKLPCFEQDKDFIDYCIDAAEKYDRGKYEFF